MRITFAATDRIKLVAKERSTDGERQMIRWWADKHNLPPNHELCVNQSITALAIEMYEDLYERKAALEKSLEATTTPREWANVSRQLSEIESALGEKQHEDTEDDLIDKWEREIREGKTPDLTEGL